MKQNELEANGELKNFIEANLLQQQACTNIGRLRTNETSKKHGYNTDDIYKTFRKFNGHPSFIPDFQILGSQVYVIIPKSMPHFRGSGEICEHKTPVHLNKEKCIISFCVPIMQVTLRSRNAVSNRCDIEGKIEMNKRIFEMS